MTDTFKGLTDEIVWMHAWIQTKDITIADIVLRHYREKFPKQIEQNQDSFDLQYKISKLSDDLTNARNGVQYWTEKAREIAKASEDKVKELEADIERRGQDQRQIREENSRLRTNLLECEKQMKTVAAKNEVLRKRLQELGEPDGKVYSTLAQKHDCEDRFEKKHTADKLMGGIIDALIPQDKDKAGVNGNPSGLKI